MQEAGTKEVLWIWEAQPTCRVPSLYHKLLDDTMEDMSIVICILCMNTEVFNSLRTAIEDTMLTVDLQGTPQHDLLLGKEFDVDIPHSGMQNSQ